MSNRFFSAAREMTPPERLGRKTRFWCDRHPPPASSHVDIPASLPPGPVWSDLPIRASQRQLSSPRRRGARLPLDGTKNANKETYESFE